MYDGPLIDVDVHHNRVSDAELIEYLPAAWRKFVTGRLDGRTVPLRPRGPIVDPPLGYRVRTEAIPPNGGPAGSDYVTLRNQLLEPFHVEHVVLGYDVGHEAGLINGDMAHVVVEAMNRWSADRWLDAHNDDRLCGAILLALHEPERAAAEVRRAAENSKFVTALLAYNALGRGYGDPIYHPVYEAAAEVGVPIHLHLSGGEYMGGSAPYQSGGGPHNYRYEIYVLSYQTVAAHLTSLIMNGVFEKYPTLNLLMSETGLSWLPWFIMTLDANHELMRRESKWVKKRPSDYIRERVVIATQPSETLTGDASRFIEHMSVIPWIDEVLCFSSDYPHWDTDMPSFIDSLIPKEWEQRVFHDNAQRVLRLPSRVAAR